MNLHTMKPNKGATHKIKRLGKGESSDPSAILVGGWDRENNKLNLVHAEVKRRVDSKLYADLIKTQKEFNCTLWGFENNNAYEYMRKSFVARALEEKVVMSMLGVTATVPQEVRIDSLEPHIVGSDPDILLLDEPTNNLDIHTIQWLEETLNERDSTMIIISHDRHFLNSVCTHMADLDYGELRVFPGNYDEYMLAATQARAQLIADNAKKKAQIGELQAFVARFSANASKAKQATSRAKQIDKIQLAEVKASSRVNPFIRFDQEKKLFRNALVIEQMNKAFDAVDSEPNHVLKNIDLMIEVGERVAVIGENGIGKTTFLRTLMNEADYKPTSGEFTWSENVNIGYYAQDHAHEFENDMTLFEWMSQWRQPTDDEQAVRGYLGRLLFSADDIKKSVKVLSGGEQGRMLFGKIMMQRPNILIMDEPTNHMDMESIESLNMAMEQFEGTIIFVSHDREFVSSLATRIIELEQNGYQDFAGTYDAYLASQSK